MIKQDLQLDAVLSFSEEFIEFEDDGVTPRDISQSSINGTAIVDKNDSSLDVPLIGGFKTDGIDGVWKITMSDADRGSIFSKYPKKAGILYEVKETLTNGLGKTLRNGILELIHSRSLSKKP